MKRLWLLTIVFSILYSVTVQSHNSLSKAYSSANTYSFLPHVVTISSISKEKVLNTIVNKTLTSIPYSNIGSELVPYSLSFYFADDNKVNGKLTNKPTNEPQQDLGIWTVDNDGKLCITWNYWNASKPFCAYLYDANNSIIFLDPDNKFVSMVVKSNIVAGNHIN